MYSIIIMWKRAGNRQFSVCYAAEDWHLPKYPSLWSNASSFCCRSTADKTLSSISKLCSSAWPCGSSEILVVLFVLRCWCQTPPVWRLKKLTVCLFPGSNPAPSAKISWGVWTGILFCHQQKKKKNHRFIVAFYMGCTLYMKWLNISS